jgi:flagellar export protein FliJ
MKRFEFRLDGILRHRARVEKEKRIQLDYAREGVVSQEKALWEAKGAAADARERLRRETGIGEIDVAQARQERFHVEALANRAAGMAERLRMLETNLAARRDEAVRAQRERKGLEILRARRRAAHIRGVERAEQKELDDVSAKKTWVSRSQDGVSQ